MAKPTYSDWYEEKAKEGETRVANRMRLSAEWVAGLDRSVLGVFAVADIHLVHADVRARELMQGSDDIHYMRAMSAAIAVAQYEYGAEFFGEDMEARAEAEWHFWREQSREFGRPQGQSRLLPTYIKRLRTVNDHPEMYGYFAADIWDMEFIGKCLSDGVDADLAVSLHV